METSKEPRNVYYSYDDFRQNCVQETPAERIARSVASKKSPKEIGHVMAKVTIESLSNIIDESIKK